MGAIILMRSQGSVSIEAAISLPVFLMAVLAVAALLQVPLACRRVGSAVSDVARMLSAGGYLASLSGFQTLQEDIGHVADNGFVPGGAKLEEVLSLLDSLGTPEGSDGTHRDRSGMLQSFLEVGTSITAQGGEVVQQTVEGALDELVLSLVSERLKEASSNRFRDEDPWKGLCISNGKAGVDFSDSRYYDEDGMVELVAVYEVKPVTLFGLAPAVKVCTRVRVMGWGAGEGMSTHAPGVAGETGRNEGEPGESIWNTGTGSAGVWRRGAHIEERELIKMENMQAGTGSGFFRASGMQSGYDAVSTGIGLQQAAVYQIVSMNPFLSSYAGRPEAIRALLRECEGSMPEKGEMVACGQPSLSLAVSDREIILVIPENTNVEVNSILDAMRKELAGLHATLRVVRGYGDFRTGTETMQEQDRETERADTGNLPD